MDLVSGDFYWIYQLPDKTQHAIICPRTLPNRVSVGGRVEDDRPWDPTDRSHGWEGTDGMLS